MHAVQSVVLQKETVSCAYMQRSLTDARTAPISATVLYLHATPVNILAIEDIGKKLRT